MNIQTRALNHDHTTDTRAYMSELKHSDETGVAPPTTTELVNLSATLHQMLSIHAASQSNIGHKRVDVEKRILHIIRARKMRDQVFSSSFFSDPAWNILLDLGLARLQNRKISVSSLSIAAGVPTTTALRWINTLVSAEMLVKRPDPGDARRSYVDLSDAVFEKLTTFLARA